MSKFDNDIKQKGENFSLPPRPEVWKRVEAELDKQNRGRIRGWWWLTPVIIIAWGFAFSFLDRKDQKAFYDQDATYHPTSEPVAKTSKKPVESIPAEAIPKEDIKPVDNGQLTAPKTLTPGSKTTEPARPVNSSKAGPVVHSTKKEPSGLKSPVTISKPVSSRPENRSYANSRKSSREVSGKTSKTSPVAASNEKETQPIVSDNPAHSPNDHIDSHTIQALTAQNENPGSAQVTTNGQAPPGVPSEQKAASHSNANQSVAIGKPAPAQKTKKSNWRLSIGAGLAINDSSVFKKRIKDSTDQSGGSTGGGGLIPEMENHQPGFSVGASLERVFALGKRWSFKPGINLQYQEIKQITGDLQPYPVDPSPPDWNYSASFYFDPGKTLEHKGNNFRVSLSSDVAFSVFKNKPSLYINAGIYGGYNIYNHFLLPDELQVWWIPAASNFYNDFFGGLSAGVEYRFKKGAGIGITGRHDLSQSFEKLREKQYYWQSVLLQFSMPLNSTR